MAKLSQYIEEKAWGNLAHESLEYYVDNSVHIEHILPQTPLGDSQSTFEFPEEYANYAQRLGNLTLLEKTINTSLSNGHFDSKKAGYKQSSFLLTKSIAEVPRVGEHTQLNQAVQGLASYDKWGSDSIEARQTMLTGIARKVWGLDL